MKVSNIFDLNQVQFNKENEVILMTSIKAPKVKNSKKRAPLNLSLVLDASSSMLGEKISKLRKSVCKLIEQLSDKDTVGISYFASHVEEIFSPGKMTSENKQKAISAVNELRASGCTNMSGGMLKGFEQLKSSDLPKGSIHRMLLFTDGQANIGLNSVGDFREMVANNIKNNPITVSCFGYGQHDEDTLKNISEIGKGNFYFIDNVDDIAKTFARELGGLLTCYAQNISIYLDLKSKSGEFEEVLNDLTTEAPTKQRVKVSLDDIFSEETKHILTKINLNKVTKAVTQRANSIVDILITYNDMTAKGKFKEVRAKAKINFVKKDKVQKEQTIEVVEQLAIIELAKAHDKARELADRGDFVGARGVMGPQGAVGTYATILTNAGSTYGAIVGRSITMATDSLTTSTYTSNVAKELSSTSRGLKAMRAVNSSTSVLYANSAQRDMENIFEDDEDDTDQIDADTTAHIDVDSNTSDSIKITDGIGNIMSPSTTDDVDWMTIPGVMDMTGTGAAGAKDFVTSDRVTIDVTPDFSNIKIPVEKKDKLNKKRKRR